MIIVIGRAEVDPADIAGLRPALDAMMRATWEESGCLSYSMAVEGDSVVIADEKGEVSIARENLEKARLVPDLVALGLAAQPKKPGGQRGKSRKPDGSDTPGSSDKG